MIMDVAEVDEEEEAVVDVVVEEMATKEEADRAVINKVGEIITTRTTEAGTKIEAEEATKTIVAAMVEDDMVMVAMIMKKVANGERITTIGEAMEVVVETITEEVAVTTITEEVAVETITEEVVVTTITEEAVETIIEEVAISKATMEAEEDMVASSMAKVRP